MQELSIIEAVGVLLSVCVGLLAPTVWFYKHSTSRLETDNEKIISEVKSSNKEQFTDIRGDLREFRNHFDVKISEVYVSLDAKNRELKDFLLKEIDYVRVGIDKVDQSVILTNNRSHELEKDILRLQNTLVKDYVSKRDLGLHLSRTNDRDTH